MDANAFIVDWTMENWRRLNDELAEAGFAAATEADSPNLRVQVPFQRMSEFAALCQAHFKDPAAYVDVQYPGRKKTVLIFAERIFIVGSAEENEAVQRWAIQQGLSPDYTGWSTSFDE